MTNCTRSIERIEVKQNYIKINYQTKKKRIGCVFVCLLNSFQFFIHISMLSLLFVQSIPCRCVAIVALCIDVRVHISAVCAFRHPENPRNKIELKYRIVMLLKRRQTC